MLIFLHRENLLKIDIYFGELKYEKIEQSRAYDILTLFSKYTLQIQRLLSQIVGMQYRCILFIS